MNPNNYITISSVIWFREPKILDSTDIERMVDAPSFSEAFRVLNDTDYADNMLGLEPTQYRNALRNDFSELYEFLKLNIPDYELFRLLFIERDFLNLRLILKEEKSETGKIEKFESETIYPPEDIRSYIQDRKSLYLDDDFKEAILNAKKEIEANKNLSWVIDSAVTKQMFQIQSKIADKLNNKFIKKAVQIKISNAAIVAFLRALRFKMTSGEFSKMLNKNSFWSISELTVAYEEGAGSLSKLVNIFQNNGVKEAAGKYLENDNLFEFERALENNFISYLKSANYFSYGPEQVYAYFYKKHLAATNMRIVLAGKLNEIEVTEIKRTLRIT